MMVGGLRAAPGPTAVVAAANSHAAVARTVAMVATLLDFIANIALGGDAGAAVEQLHHDVARVARIVQRLEDPAYGVDKREYVFVLVLSVVIILEGKLQCVLLDLRSRRRAHGDACLCHVVSWGL